MYTVLYYFISVVLLSEGLPADKNAVDLLMETCAVESDFMTYNKQIGGPALGIFQMEPDTLHDIRVNYIKYRPELREFLEGNLLDVEFAIIAARIHYMRVSTPIPSTRLLRAKYWKQYYNTHLGRGTVEKYMEKAQRYLGDANG